MGICSILSFLPPSLLSVPNADYWRSPEHYPEACRMGFNWSLWFGAMSLLWTAGLHYELVQANRLTPPHLDSARFLILTGAFILGMAVLAIGLLRSFRRAAQPA